MFSVQIDVKTDNNNDALFDSPTAHDESYVSSVEINRLVGKTSDCTKDSKETWQFRGNWWE